MGKVIKVHRDSETDYLSIDFSNEVEAKSEYKEGKINEFADGFKELRNQIS